MVKESAFWNNIKKGMGKRWSASRHEDRVGVGVPDVSYGIKKINGWIELKSVKRPKKDTSIINIVISPFQIRWLQDRGKAGGNTWLFIKADKEYYLFDYTNLHYFKRPITFADLKKLAFRIWKNKVDWNELADILSNGLI